MTDTNKPNTVKCRIALALSETGRWEAFGSSISTGDAALVQVCDDMCNYGPGEERGAAIQHHIVTVEVPIPEVREVEGVVEGSEPREPTIDDVFDLLIEVKCKNPYLNNEAFRKSLRNLSHEDKIRLLKAELPDVAGEQP